MAEIAAIKVRALAFQLHTVLFALALTLLPASGFGQTADTAQPEGASPAIAEARGEVTARRFLVAAANRHAAEAGRDILRRGGSAIDAMVAVQLVLGLVEPQSSGLGGGGFLVYWNAEQKQLTTLDARETAPMRATPRLFQDAAGKPLEFYDAVLGGRSVGVPGIPRLLEQAHRKWGRLAWRELFGPAMRLAEEGFAVSPRLFKAIGEDKEQLARFPGARAYFFDAAGSPVGAGTVLKNPDFANTLGIMREEGAAPFYSGRIAAGIVEAVQSAPGNPGVLTLADLASYEVKERAAACLAYRGFDVCGMGPPSSGALAVGQILGILENFDVRALGPANPGAWQLFGDATRLAFADRDRFMADEDFVPMPTKGLLDKSYLAERAKLIELGHKLGEAKPGTPKWDHARLYGDGISMELPSTTHFVIVDEARNVVSMTSSIEDAFGARLMTHGFLLNNQLTDFSFASQVDGVPIANRVEPGKRPRSSMS
ncbi:MAG: gamma-glutamyltransferase family protein, partial [Pseudomonadota bacterium]|nr:gamma-glutamyltransferase family protein [Pseudomonadota bacterium]